MNATEEEVMDKKEIDPLNERKEIMQEVIDRHVKFGNAYAKALKKFNEKFSPGMKEEGSSLNPDSKIRVYGKNSEES